MTPTGSTGINSSLKTKTFNIPYTVVPELNSGHSYSLRPCAPINHWLSPVKPPLRPFKCVQQRLQNPTALKRGGMRRIGFCFAGSGSRCAPIISNNRVRQSVWCRLPEKSRQTTPNRSCKRISAHNEGVM